MKTLTQIIEIIKKKGAMENEKRIAEVLKMNYQTLMSRKSRNSIPYKKLVDFCAEYNVSLDDLLLGPQEDSTRVLESSTFYDHPDLKKINDILRNQSPEIVMNVLKLLKHIQGIDDTIQNMTAAQLRKETDLVHIIKRNPKN